MVSVNAAIEDHLRENGDVASRGKKSGVAGDAAHGPGVFVVDFARTSRLRKWCRFRWARCRARSERGGLKSEFFIASGAKISLCANSVERFAGKALDDFAEQNESEVGVFDLRAGLVDERLGHDAREDASWPFASL